MAPSFFFSPEESPKVGLLASRVSDRSDSFPLNIPATAPLDWLMTTYRPERPESKRPGPSEFDPFPERSARTDRVARDREEAERLGEPVPPWAGAFRGNGHADR